MSHACICDWLGLPAEAWPPDHYRLLGLPLGEGDAARIEQQVHDRLEVVRRYQLLQPDHVTEAMNRLAQAFVCLTDPQAKKEYDAKLSQTPALGPVVDDAIAEAPAVDSPDPLAWLYSREAQTAAAARAVTQLDVPAVEFKGPPDDAEMRGPESAPPVRRSGALALSGNGDTATPVSSPHDSILEAAKTSASARRGLGTKRALYHRVARTRQLLRVWYEVGQFLRHPGRRLVKPVEATDLIHGLITLRTELKSFPPLLGQAGQPGYLVIALARQQVIVPTFQTLLPSQREALARDWRAGLKLLDAHLQFLRQELRVTRRRGLLGHVTRGLSSLLHARLGLLLMSLMILAFLIAFCRSVGAEWIGQLLESTDGTPAHSSVGEGLHSNGVANAPRANRHSDRETNPVQKDEPPLPPLEDPAKIGPPLPPEVKPPPAPEKNEEPNMPRRYLTEDIYCVTSVALLPDHRFAFRNSKGGLSFWGRSADSPTSVDLPNPLTEIVFSPRTAKVACGDEKGGIYLFNADAFGKEIRESGLKKAHEKAVDALAFSSDGKWLLSGGADGKVNLWDIGSGASNRNIAREMKRIRAAALSEFGERAYWGGDEGRVHAWDVANDRNIDLPNGPSDTITSLVLSPDDRFLYCTAKDRSIWQWDLKDSNKAPRREKLGAEATCLAVSPDGRFLLSGEERKINVWDARTGKYLHTIGGKYDLVFSLAFSADGKQVISGHERGVLILWPISMVEESGKSESK
jgi:hypothetical protein